MRKSISRKTLPSHFGARHLLNLNQLSLVQIFDVAGETVTQLAELSGHEGPVWAVAWAHPRFGGGLLASASFDHRVLLWVESSGGVHGGSSSWQRLPFEPPPHSASVNALAFAPQELGLALAAASSDGSVSVLTAQQTSSSNQNASSTTAEGWSADRIERAHAAGVLGLSWLPSPTEKRLATCGCDNLVKIWRFDGNNGGWTADGPPLAAHSEWVRDVAFAPRLASPSSAAASASTSSSSSSSSSSPVLASAGQDGKVLVWSEDPATGNWTPTPVCDFGPGQPVWRVSWSTAGGVLAVSDSRGAVSLWKESVDGQWEQVSAPA